jgi:hypothetical protein
MSIASEWFVKAGAPRPGRRVRSREPSVIRGTSRAPFLAFVANEVAFLAYFAILHVSVFPAHTAHTLRHFLLPREPTLDVAYVEWSHQI